MISSCFRVCCYELLKLAVLIVGQGFNTRLVNTGVSMITISQYTPIGVMYVKC